MVDNPLWSFVEQGAAWMDKNLLVVTDSLVAFSRILTTAMVEEACTDRLTNLRVIFHL